MKTESYQVRAVEERISSELDYTNNNSPTVISLHGGGPSDKGSTAYLSKLFYPMAKNVIRFDFSGQGESSGELKNSSLKKRYNEAKAVLESFQVTGPLTVIGSSMGGYIATKLLEEYTVETLILFCPAAYSRKAWDVRFSEGFTEIIRSKDSFLDSDIEDILRDFRGKSLLVMGREDDVIPSEVVKMYRAGLTNSSLFQFHEIEKCPHPIHRWVKRNEESMNVLIEKMEAFLA